MTTENKTEQTEKKESAFFAVRTYEKIKDACTDKVNAYNEKYLKKYVDSGKEFKDGLEKDARKLVDNVVEKGKNMMPEFKIVNSVKDKAVERFEKVRDMINLPTRNDLDRLTEAMDSLNAKVNKLSEKYSV